MNQFNLYSTPRKGKSESPVVNYAVSVIQNSEEDGAKKNSLLDYLKDVLPQRNSQEQLLCLLGKLCVNAVAVRNTAFSFMDDFGILFHSNLLFISPRIRSLLPCRGYESIIFHTKTSTGVCTQQGTDDFTVLIPVPFAAIA